MILGPITLFVELQIMLNPTPGVSNFLVLARRDSGGNGPKTCQDGNSGNEDEKDPCEKTPADLASEV